TSELSAALDYLASLRKQVKKISRKIPKHLRHYEKVAFLKVFHRTKLEKLNTLHAIAQEGDIAVLSPLILSQDTYLEAPDVLRLIFQQLLSRKDEFNIDIRNRKGYSPLMLAILADNTKLVRAILALGPDVNARDIFGRSVLHLALRQGNV